MTIPMKYRKKPVEIDAMTFTGEMDDDIELWLGSSFNSWLPSQQKLEIITLEGIITASAGDYVIRGVQGEFYPCKPDIFEQTYERVDAPALSEQEQAEVDRFGIHDDDTGHL